MTDRCLQRLGLCVSRQDAVRGLRSNGFYVLEQARTTHVEESRSNFLINGAILYLRSARLGGKYKGALRRSLPTIGAQGTGALLLTAS